MKQEATRWASVETSAMTEALKRLQALGRNHQCFMLKRLRAFQVGGVLVARPSIKTYHDYSLQWDYTLFIIEYRQYFVSSYYTDRLIWIIYQTARHIESNWLASKQSAVVIVFWLKYFKLITNCANHFVLQMRMHVCVCNVFN